MQNRNKDNSHISSMRCKKTLNFLGYMREANCSSTFFKTNQQEEERMQKCAEATDKMAEIAELCAKKFT